MGEEIKENKAIHIVFICDEAYVMPTVVAIESLLLSKRTETQYFVHVLGSEISAGSRNIFLKMVQDGLRIEVLDLVQSPMMQRAVIENLHVSTAALYKFNIAKLFPAYEKVLYLDGDILIQKDLTELYHTDVSEVYAAVVKDYKPMTYRPPQVKKLGIQHNAYFNSGVMLLNLNKFREDGLAEKLLDYRINGINFFMDQDALNVVFQEKVVYLPFLYNVMSSVMGYFKFSDIKEYYELQELTSKDEIYRKATIIHLCTKFKPWNFSDVPFADQWMHCYSKSPYTEPLKRNRLEKKDRDRVFSESGQKMTPRTWNIQTELILSLTSFPARIDLVPKVIESLQEQTVRVDRIVLWLAESQFPDKENDLPSQIIEQAKNGVEIHWCEDLKPHKKYFYTMQAFPNSIVITVDDDIYYDSKLVEHLLDSYVKYPYAVSATRAHLVTFENGAIAPYKNWKREIALVGVPSYALCATGVGGVLYPPHCLTQEVFNLDAIKQTCLNADDLWLKVIEIISGVPVVVARKPQKLNYIDGSQDVALWKNNDALGANDPQLAAILDRYDALGGMDTVTRRLHISYENFDAAAASGCTGRRISKIRENDAEESCLIRASWSYRIGRFITWIPRKVRGGIRCYREHGWHYTWNRLLYHLNLKKS